MTHNEWNSLTREEKLARVNELPKVAEQTLVIRSPRIRLDPNRLTGRQAVLIGAAFAGVFALIFVSEFIGGESSAAYSPPAMESRYIGYGKGFELGLGMGKAGAGMPTDESLRSMSAIHAPSDQLQFRIGYRNGLVAGAEERLASR